MKQTDFDGKFSYSKVISVNGNIDIMNNIDIRYISRKKLINIHCDEQTQKNTELIEILGGNGQTEYRSYKYQSQISTENIANGIYFLYCKQKYNETIIKFVID